MVVWLWMCFEWTWKVQSVSLPFPKVRFFVSSLSASLVCDVGLSASKGELKWQVNVFIFSNTNVLLLFSSSEFLLTEASWKPAEDCLCSVETPIHVGAVKINRDQNADVHAAEPDSGPSFWSGTDLSFSLVNQIIPTSSGMEPWRCLGHTSSPRTSPPSRSFWAAQTETDRTVVGGHWPFYVVCGCGCSAALDPSWHHGPSGRQAFGPETLQTSNYSLVLLIQLSLLAFDLFVNSFSELLRDEPAVQLVLFMWELQLRYLTQRASLISLMIIAVFPSFFSLQYPGHRHPVQPDHHSADALQHLRVPGRPGGHSAGAV